MKYLLCLLLLALTLCVANAAFAVYYTEQYEMDFPPNLVQGTVNGHVLSTGGGSGVYGPDGSQFGNGVMTFLDNYQSSGNQGYYSTGIWLGNDFTFDMRLKVLQDTQPSSNGRSFSFKGGNQQGRGLRVNTNGVCFMSGTGLVGSAGSFDFTSFDDFRVIIKGSDNTASFYHLSDHALLAQATMGGSGWAQELAQGLGQFALGSLSETTTLSNFELDWVRVEANASDPYVVYQTVPEPGALLALGSGLLCMAGSVLRRKRTS